MTNAKAFLLELNEAAGPFSWLDAAAMARFSLSSGVQALNPGFGQQN